MPICVQFSTRDRAEACFRKKDNLSKRISPCPGGLERDAKVRQDAGIGRHQETAVRRELQSLGVFADVFALESNDQDVVGMLRLSFGNFRLHEREVDRDDFRGLVFVGGLGFFFSARDQGEVEAALARDDDRVGVGSVEGGGIKKLEAGSGRIDLKVLVRDEEGFFRSWGELGGSGESVVEELVAFSRDGEGEALGGTTIFGDEVSFAGRGEIESQLTFAKNVAGDDSAVGAGPNIGFVFGKGVAGDYAVERVDGEGGFGLIFEDVIEAMETARLIDLEGGAIFLEVASRDAGGFIEGGDIGRTAIVDACFGAAENVELIQVDAGAFHNLNAADGLSAAVERGGSRA